MNAGSRFSCMDMEKHVILTSQNVEWGGRAPYPPPNLLVDLRGGAPDAPIPAQGPKCSPFYALFGNFGKIVCWCPPEGWHLLLRGILDPTLPSHSALTTKLEKCLFTDFMVDSGSDVVTVREEVLHQLDLELLGTIQSRGVHATKQKQLYKAVLKIGDVDVEIEVRYGIKKSCPNKL